MYPKVSGLAAWSENCKRYNYLPLGAVVSLFCEFCFSTSVYCCWFFIESVRKLLVTHLHMRLF